MSDEITKLLDEKKRRGENSFDSIELRFIIKQQDAALRRLHEDDMKLRCQAINTGITPVILDRKWRDIAAILKGEKQ